MSTSRVKRLEINCAQLQSYICKQQRQKLQRAEDCAVVKNAQNIGQRLANDSWESNTFFFMTKWTTQWTDVSRNAESVLLLK